MSFSWRDVRDGVVDIAPVLVAAAPIGVLWGSLAAGKGLSPLEAFAFSAMVFAGAAQFVALDLWRDPAPWLFLGFTVFIVNVRHVLMGASLARHLGSIPRRWHWLVSFLLADENWALSERQSLGKPLTLAYYLGLALPMYAAWTASTLAGAIIGKTLGDPAAIGFDFAFSAMFIGILAGFWKGSRTAAVLAASAAGAAAAKLFIPGAWYIVIGGVVGVAVAALLYREGEA